MSAAGGSWLISFRVGGAEAALPLAVVREVTARPPITRVPEAIPLPGGREQTPPRTSHRPYRWMPR